MNKLSWLPRLVRGRVTWPNLTEGALISTVPQGLSELGEYLGQSSPGLKKRVVAVRFSSDEPDQFQTSIPITWEKLTFQEGQGPADSQNLSAPTLPLETLWLPGRQLAAVVGAETQLEESALRVRTKTGDPQLTFSSAKNLSSIKTIMVRAKFSLADRVDFFFGRQIDGRGIPGYVPAANQWLDIYINVAANPYWQSEAGNLIRFDPASEGAVGSTIEIKGICGSPENLPVSAKPEMVFYPSH